MYSVVAAAVFSIGTPQPGFGGLFHHNQQPMGYGCVGCVGCYGGCAGCGGCVGCNGFLGIRSFFSGLFSFGGCQGCGGCYGGCVGCAGCFGCVGCAGCFGGMPVMGGMPMASYGGGFGMPMSFDASPMGGMPVMPGMAAGPDMIGGLPPGFAAAPVPGFGAMPPGFPTVPAQPGQVPGQMPAGPMPQAYDSVTPANQATVVVELPADARLFVDGAPITLTGSVRVFRTPELQPGVKYSYTMKVEFDRAGQTQSDTKVVDLQPGRTTRVRFGEPAASGTARIDVKTPAGAKLVVEGQEWPSGQRSIVTPVLEPGRDYVYTLRLQRDRAGRSETLSRDVTFRAGESVAVDFADARAAD